MEIIFGTIRTIMTIAIVALMYGFVTFEEQGKFAKATFCIIALIVFLILIYGGLLL